MESLEGERREQRARAAVRRAARRSAAASSGALLAVTAISAAGPAAAVTKPVVSVVDIAGLGRVLVAGGHPLYVTTADPRGHSKCGGQCATIWIPLVVSGAQVHRLGHVRGLTTIRRAGGRRQVAVHGRPLYYLRSEHSTAAANGEGVDNIWFAVHPDGTVARPLMLGQTPTSPSPSTTTTVSGPASHGSGPLTTPPTPTPSPAAGSGTPPAPAPTAPTPTTAPANRAPTPPPPTTTSPPTTTVPSGGGVSF